MPKVVKGKERKIRCGNKGNVVLTIRRPDGSIREVQQYHNAVNQAMIGREVYWTSYEVTSEPITQMSFANSGDVDTYTYATGSYAGAAVSGSYSAVWYASHTASQTETITTIALLNANSVNYCDATVSVAMTSGETLDVTWTHYFTAATEDIGVLTNAYLYSMEECFRNSLTTYPISTTNASKGILAYHNGSTLVSAVATISSGGTTDDTSTTWYADIENTLSTGTLTYVYAGYCNDPVSTYDYIVEYNVDPDLTWTLNQTYRITITIAWSDAT
jgi:hypothetical protein